MESFSLRSGPKTALESRNARRADSTFQIRRFSFRRVVARKGNEEHEKPTDEGARL